MSNSQPRWQPITMLPLFAEMLDGQLASGREQIAALERCRPKPHVLDDATVQRVKSAYEEYRDFLPLNSEQLRRWKAAVESEAQHNEVARLEAVNDQWSAVIDQVLALVDELAKGTIDKIMAMDDGELGLAFLQGRVKPPHFR